MADAISPGRRSLIAPLLVIVLGLLLLLQNLGLLPWGLWGTLWRFWPLALVVAGIELILRRAAPRLAALVILLLGVIAVAVLLAIAARSYQWPSLASRALTGERLVEMLADVEQAVVELKFGAGEIALGSLPPDSSSLIEADLTQPDGQTAFKDVQRRGNEARVLLESRRSAWLPFGSQPANRWDLRLSRRVPLDLRVQAGASQVRLTLADLRVTRLRVDAGASELRILLPQAAGTLRAAIAAGAADVTIDVPEGVAARIRVKSAIGSVNVDERRFPKSKDGYTSSDYDVATDRVDLELDTGASSVTVR